MALNLYTDTRGLMKNAVPFTQAVVDGLAGGGGLYVPERLPHFGLDDIVGLADLTYPRRAAFVYRAFDTDLPGKTVDALMEGAYGSAFDTEEVCPVTSLTASTHILELWHGPTSAFKDMALQCLPLFFSESAKKLKAEGRLDHDFLILVATSGDTGKAALEGFKDKEGVRIAVLYPEGGVSDIQLRQMVTQAGKNVCVWGIRGNFDDCQSSVKAVFGDEAFGRRLLDDAGIALTSANSINWGRLLPQVVYYLSAYATLVRTGRIGSGDEIDICVPTGNFGNILAAWYAGQMGMPLGMLLCASNSNRVLTDFINTGTYDISGREFVTTVSPSMDILVSSNLERQLFELTGRDGQAVRGWMGDLNDKGAFRIGPETFARLRSHFAADSIDDATCLSTIREVYKSHGYLLDPHTAVAYRAAQNLRGENPVLIAGTAHWAKFGTSVYRALYSLAPEAALPPDAACLSGCALGERIARETGCGPVPENLAALEGTNVRFTGIIESTPCDIESAIGEFLSGQF